MSKFQKFKIDFKNCQFDLRVPKIDSAPNSKLQDLQQCLKHWQKFTAKIEKLTRNSKYEFQISKVEFGI